MKMLTMILSLLTLFFVLDLFGTNASWQMDLSYVGLEHMTLALHASGLANFFALLMAFSFVVMSVSAYNYKLSRGFYFLLYLLTVSLLLIVYAADYLLFFIGWEVMSITTYLLLSYTLSSRALIKYIVFAMASAMALLAAIVILYSGTQTFLYADAHLSYRALSETLRMLFVILMLFAFFVKLGMIGFHYWLVDSYSESHDFFTPYLSAVLSKMAVYALIILLVYVIDISTLSGSWIAYTLALIGLLSSVIANFKALNEDSIKRVLAYSSIAQLGYIVTVLSFADGMSGALYHSFIHTLVKLLLFINVAGIIYMTTKSKFSELGGLIYRMPQSFVLLLIGIIVLAGMPPLAGFASKYLIYNTLLEHGNLLILSAMMFSSASAFLYIYKLIYGIYLGHPTSKKLENAQEVPLFFLLPQYAIAVILVILGAFPGLLSGYFNSILSEMGLNLLPETSATVLATQTGSYNGFIVMAGFIAVFMLVLLLLLSLRSKAKEAKDRFDIAYCGEVPNEGTHLHYGFSMGKELRRVGFIGVILKNSVSHFYDYLSRQLFSLSSFMRKIYSGNLSVNFNIAIIFILVLLLWRLK